MDVNQLSEEISDDIVTSVVADVVVNWLAQEKSSGKVGKRTKKKTMARMKKALRKQLEYRQGPKGDETTACSTSDETSTQKHQVDCRKSAEATPSCSSFSGILEKDHQESPLIGENWSNSCAVMDSSTVEDNVAQSDQTDRRDTEVASGSSVSTETLISGKPQQWRWPGQSVQVKNPSQNDKTACENKRLRERMDILSRRCIALQEICAAFRMREAEHLHKKVVRQFSARTVLLVESSLFSDSISCEDSVLNEQPVQVVSSGLIEKVETRLFIKGEFADISELFFEGEQIICKSPRINDSTDENSHIRRLMAVAREYRILNLVDPHANVVKPLAIGMVKDMPSLLLTYCGSTTLTKHLQENEILADDEVCSIVRGVGYAVSHLHMCGVLHFNLKTQNVVVRNTLGSCQPILVGFSLACRAEASKSLTKSQQEYFSNQSHIPSEVLSGLELPSYSTDVYSFGVMLRKFFIKITSGVLQKSISRFVFSCTAEESCERPLHGDFVRYLEFYTDV